MIFPFIPKSDPGSYKNRRRIFFMQVVSTHSHLLSDAVDLDKIAESGMFSQVWLLGLHTGWNIRFNSGLYHPASEEEMLEDARRFPGFYLPFKWIDFNQGPDQVDRAVERGFVGFKGIKPKLPYDDDKHLEIYERISRYKTCMIFHTGHVSTPSYEDRVPGLGYDALNMSPSTLLKIVKFFPDMTVVAAHCGVPWQNETVSTCFRSSPNFYMDISGGEFSPVLTEFICKNALLSAALPNGATGILADKLLYGMDVYFGHPQLHEDIRGELKRVLAWAKGIEESDAAWKDRLENIFSGNAARVMKHNDLAPKSGNQSK